MKKEVKKYSPEVRERAVRMVLEHGGDYPSRWAAVSSIAAKIGCNAVTLHEWVKRWEIDRGSGGPNCWRFPTRDDARVRKDRPKRSPASAKRCAGF